MIKAKLVKHREARYQEYPLYWLKKDWDKTENFGLYHEDGSFWGGANRDNFDEVVNTND